jgi:hypothetical protein
MRQFLVLELKSRSKRDFPAESNAISRRFGLHERHPKDANVLVA